ncbi:WYL domain-containing protein [Streptomyces sp. DSM 44915]|uniref:WYL domain-containing protein n=2 Tax=Streptomyces chisholmiae TaxID=3075540 RepID=A0ABU2JQ88_9ACTN|nr:WYL domain-containing protein [Streptomyces sp. DSM 44915]MDT0266378.1 WYL domain-containing protein [Streptomyces sp. DSM 44915]
MRADRLLSLLLLLQNRGRLTAPELARELEVSVRTVYRDVEALAAAGVPVYADRGPAGGYRLLHGYRTRLTGLTDAEAESLFLAGVPAAARALGLDAELAAASLKVRAALPAESAGRAERVAERFHLDAHGWFREHESVPQLAVLARAVWEQRPVHAHYRGWRAAGARELWPLGLVLKGGIWYVVAERRPAATEAATRAMTTGAAATGGTATGRTSTGEGAAAEEAGSGPLRSYRAARFGAVRLGAERFERPADFDLAAYWAEFTRRLSADRFREVACLRLAPRAARLLPMFFGAAGAEALAAADPADQDGWTTVHLAVETTAIAVGDLLRLGPDAEVLGPPALRAAVATAVRGLADRYADDPAGAPADGHPT